MKYKGVPIGPAASPQVTELLRRHKASKKAGAEISRRLHSLIEKLVVKFPEEIKTIEFYLEGERARLLSERNQLKLKEDLSENNRR